MIKICSHILFKTTALKSEVKASLFRFQKAKAALARVASNEELSRVPIGLKLILLLREISRSIGSFSMACKINKLQCTLRHKSLLTIIMSLKLKRSVLSIKDNMIGLRSYDVLKM